VQDETGQTLQYRLETRTLEHPDPTSAWQSFSVPLWAGTLEHWGGRNTGSIEGKLEGFLYSCGGKIPNSQAAASLILMRSPSLRPRRPNVTIDPRIRSLPEPEVFRPLASLLGVSIHSLNDDAALDVAKDAGFGFVRADIFWNQLEQANRFQFSAYVVFSQGCVSVPRPSYGYSATGIRITVENTPHPSKTWRPSVDMHPPSAVTSKVATSVLKSGMSRHHSR